MSNNENRIMSNGENYNHLLHYELTTDILQTIPDDDLPALCDILRTQWPYAAQAWHLVNQYINWKKLNPKLGARFTCPEGNWRDGTFVAILTELKYQIYFFTLENSCERLCKALRETEVIEWKKGPFICAIHEDHDEKIMKVLDIVGGEFEFEIPSTCWFLSKETALKFDIEYPEDISIQPLSPEDSILMNSVWPHIFPGSEKFISNMISRNGGYGVLTNKSDLCSWITINYFGTVGVLQTLDKYKRNGYAMLLVKYLTKKLAESNLDSVAYIVRKNIVSQTLFKNIGYRLNNYIRWIQFKELESRSLSYNKN